MHGRNGEGKLAKLKRILLALLFAGSLAAQTFLHLSDPQFGFYTNNKGFEQETANFEFAIATANRLKPAFVIITGDLTHSATDPAELAEYKRIAAKLDPKIRLFEVPGNHDVGNEPTRESLVRYRERYGPDYYSFQMGGIYGIVLNSNLETGGKNVPDEAAKMEAWLRSELEKAKSAAGKQVLVFQHIPFFRKDVNEPTDYQNIALEARRRYLAMLREFGVKWVFTGHLHQTLEVKDGDTRFITTGAVGMPEVGAKSGLSVVAVSPDGVKHRFFEFGELPSTLTLK